MSREYEPMGRQAPGRDLLVVQEEFSAAAEPYLSFPWSWVCWGLLLPLAALSTSLVFRWQGARGVLLLWFGTVVLGGLVEMIGIRKGRKQHGASELGTWVMVAQGNLSLVAVLISIALLIAGRAELLPGVWLLILGHSFFSLGSLGFPPFRRFGLSYQLAGAVALWPSLVEPLWLFAGVTCMANLGVALAIWRAETQAD